MDENRLTSGEAPAAGRAGGNTDEASRVERRLERIEALDRERAPAGHLLAELRALVHEAEALARIESGGSSPVAVTKLGEEAEGMH